MLHVHHVVRLLKSGQSARLPTSAFSAAHAVVKLWCLVFLHHLVLMRLHKHQDVKRVQLNVVSVVQVDLGLGPTRQRAQKISTPRARRCSYRIFLVDPSEQSSHSANNRRKLALHHATRRWIRTMSSGKATNANIVSKSGSCHTTPVDSWTPRLSVVEKNLRQLHGSRFTLESPESCVTHVDEWPSEICTSRRQCARGCPRVWDRRRPASA